MFYLYLYLAAFAGIVVGYFVAALMMMASGPGKRIRELELENKQLRNTLVNFRLKDPRGSVGKC